MTSVLCLLGAESVHPRKFPVGTLNQIRRIAKTYPGYDRCRICRAKPLPVDHPYRFAGATEYTHTVEVYYSDEYSFLAGITASGDVHVWMD